MSIVVGHCRHVLVAAVPLQVDCSLYFQESYPYM
jgi:hypothetical protein